LLGDSNLPPIGLKVWEDTHILVPSCDSCETYRNAFTGEVMGLPKADAKIAVSELLAHFPAALCMLGESPVSARRHVHPRGR
jgi:maltooligosyltrehalose synthase